MLEPLRDRRHRAAAATLAGLLTLAAPPLAAHSFWPTYYSAKSAVAMADDGLRAGVVIEVPTFELVAGFREHFADLDLMKEIQEGRFAKLEAQYNDHLFASFAAEMELEIDGSKVPGEFRPVDSPANGKGTEGFFVYMLEFAFETGEGAATWTNEP
ncbi:MAG: hypothetical protein R3190_17330, partial [Thermoanaerobaculia bacterium]|nr:hypothetical protein [Thermoanaerobaculia bacterium]